MTWSELTGVDWVTFVVSLLSILIAVYLLCWGLWLWAYRRGAAEALEEYSAHVYAKARREARREYMEGEGL